MQCPDALGVHALATHSKITVCTMPWMVNGVDGMNRFSPGAVDTASSPVGKSAEPVWE